MSSDEYRWMDHRALDGREETLFSETEFSPRGSGTGTGAGKYTLGRYGDSTGDGEGRGHTVMCPCITQGTFDGQLIYQLLRPQAGEVQAPHLT